MAAMALDLDVPCRLGVRVNWAIKAGQELRARLWLKAQCIGEHRLVRSGHAAILRLALAWVAASRFR